MAVGAELCLLSRGWHRRLLEAVARRTPEDLTAAASRWLDPDRAGVLGWSLPTTSPVDPRGPGRGQG
jgi:hypothetical protein